MLFPVDSADGPSDYPNPGNNPYPAANEILLTKDIATQAEVDAGISNAKIVTSQTLKNSAELSGKANVSHTHTHTDITDWDTAVANSSPVKTVSGRTGNVTITHSDITDFATAVANSSPVSTVAGRAGNVTLSKTDVGLSNVQNVDTTNANNISSGTLPNARLDGTVLRSRNVFFASEHGCALNSNIDTGGGTDDTVALQSLLDTIHASGGGVLVIDGVALVSGVLAYTAGHFTYSTTPGYTNIAIHKGALVVRSNTEIHFTRGSGLFLAANSNCQILSTDLNGATVINRYIAITGFPVLNCNDANQSKVENGPGTPSPYVMGVYFGSVQFFYVENLILRNAKTFAFTIANAYNGKIVNTRFHWDDTSHNNSPNQNRDGFHFWGPIYDLEVIGGESNGDDDCLAFNTDENVNAGDPYRGSPTDVDLYGQPLGVLQNITVRDFYFNNASNGIRFIGYGTSNQTIHNVRVINCYGNITYVNMNCSGVNIDSFEINGWHVSGLSDINIFVGSGAGSVRLEGIDAGVIVSTDAPTTSGDYFSGGGGSSPTKILLNGASDDGQTPFIIGGSDYSPDGPQISFGGIGFLSRYTTGCYFSAGGWLSNSGSWNLTESSMATLALNDSYWGSASIMLQHDPSGTGSPINRLYVRTDGSMELGGAVTSPTTAGAITLLADLSVIMSGVVGITSDPHVLGKLWNNSGHIAISAG